MAGNLCSIAVYPSNTIIWRIFLRVSNFLHHRFKQSIVLSLPIWIQHGVVQGEMKKSRFNSQLGPLEEKWRNLETILTIFINKVVLCCDSNLGPMDGNFCAIAVYSSNTIIWRIFLRIFSFFHLSFHQKIVLSLSIWMQYGVSPGEIKKSRFNLQLCPLAEKWRNLETTLMIFINKNVVLC